MPLRSAFDFDPNQENFQLSELFSSRVEKITIDSGRKLVLRFLDRKELTLQEMGRILIVMGKYRSVGIQLQFYCSVTIYEQLQSCYLDRIIWMEPDPSQK